MVILVLRMLRLVRMLDPLRAPLKLHCYKPGDDADPDLLPIRILPLSVEGVACMVICLMPTVLLPQTMCAGRSHRLV